MDSIVSEYQREIDIINETIEAIQALRREQMEDTDVTSPKNNNTNNSNTGWVQSGNNWYYYNQQGQMAYGGWHKLSWNGKEDWYYFDNNGVMAANSNPEGYTVNGSGQYVDTGYKGTWTEGKWKGAGTGTITTTGTGTSGSANGGSSSGSGLQYDATVAQIQQYLNEDKGCNLTVDGKYGPLTQAAVKEWWPGIDYTSKSAAIAKWNAMQSKNTTGSKTLNNTTKDQVQETDVKVVTAKFSVGQTVTGSTSVTSTTNGKKYNLSAGYKIKSARLVNGGYEYCIPTVDGDCYFKEKDLSIANVSTVHTSSNGTVHGGGGGGRTFDTGGYTGEWGDSGKLAILHEKELILNKEDTANILAAVQGMRQIVSSQLGQKAVDIMTNKANAAGAANHMTIDQKVQIDATFPNVSVASEIEDAFNSLVNKAAQYNLK